tara:strand:+ start:141 stop:593 length:453 start_codon:yes stop_codon:yes gene_type:complete
MKASQAIRNKIIEICPWAKGMKIEQITSPVNTIEIYAVRRKDGDNTYFLSEGKHLNTCFSSNYWRLDDFRSSLSYYGDCPDSVLRAINKDNGGGYWTKRQVIDKLLEVKAGSKTALDEVMARLNWEDDNEKKYKISPEIAEHELGRKLST